MKWRRGAILFGSIRSFDSASQSALTIESMTGLKLSISSAMMIVLLAGTLVPRQAKAAEPMRDFIMSCSYGVLAGTLVGAATLAFSDKPGDNLNKVARGASYGLYAGILLGLYVVYGVPNQEEAEIRDQLGQNQFKSQFRSRKIAELPKFFVAPVMGEKGLEGGEVRYNVFQF